MIVVDNAVWKLMIVNKIITFQRWWWYYTRYESAGSDDGKSFESEVRYIDGKEIALLME